MERDVDALSFTDRHRICVGITRRDTDTIPVFSDSLELHTLRDKGEVVSAGDNIFQQFFQFFCGNDCDSNRIPNANIAG